MYTPNSRPIALIPCYQKCKQFVTDSKITDPITTETCLTEIDTNEVTI